ncbi:MAG: ribonuclease HII, partial [Defluviitaleaceae bacterium]|nr:ribonuclease HII [Defluviitaleaceae bacterium]
FEAARRGHTVSIVYDTNQIRTLAWLKERGADLNAKSNDGRTPLSEAVSAGIGRVEHDVIDEINILRATHRAMAEALASLDPQPQHVLVDGHPAEGLCVPQTSIIKGDSKSYHIAAASIIAKVTRDRIMRGYHELYPEYDFAKHKGYGTKMHLEAIKNYGLSPIHRISFCGKMS